MRKYDIDERLPLCTVGQPSVHGIRTILIRKLSASASDALDQQHAVDVEMVGGHAYNGDALKAFNTRLCVPFVFHTLKLTNRTLTAPPSS